MVIPNGCWLFHENSASQTSFAVIPTVIFFPYSHPCLNFAKSRFPGSSQIRYPVSAFPNPALSFGQIPYSVSVFPNPAQYFGQIPDPVTIFPNPTLSFGQVPYTISVFRYPALSFGQIPDSRISLGVIHQTRKVHQIRFRVTLPPNHLVTNEIATKKSTRHHIITLQQLTLYSPGIAGADLGGGGGAGGLHPPSPEDDFGFLIQLIFCIKICLHHQSVGQFLSGAPPLPKKNPGSIPALLLLSQAQI